MNVAYLDSGQIRILRPGAAAQLITSPYAEKLRQIAVKEEQRHAWKGANEGPASIFGGAALWGKQPQGRGVRIAFTSVASGLGNGQFFYSLETDNVCGVLSGANFGESEQRIWNHNTQKLSDLNVHPQLGHLTGALQQRNGSSHIAIRLAEDAGVSQVTEGDTIDAAPRWVAADGVMLVFQSAGVARDRAGQWAGQGPFSIQKLNPENGEMECLAEHKTYDYIFPFMTPDGMLYFIRRPWAGTFRVKPLALLSDVLLFPFRLLRAIGAYLNFFSLIYSGKKLTSVKTPDARQMDLKQMMIYGNLVQATKAGPQDEHASWAPKDWILCRRLPNGAEETLAKGVLCFDVAADGTILYSNGGAIYSVVPGQKPALVATGAMIERLAILR